MKADEVAGRRVKVAQQLLANRSVREIARELDTPKTTIHRDIKAVRQEWQRYRLGAIDDLVAEDLQRLREAEKAIWPHVIEGVHESIDRLLKIMERRAKLLGIDAPTRIDLMAFVRRLAEDEGLDPIEAEQEAKNIVSRVYGSSG